LLIFYHNLMFCIHYCKIGQKREFEKPVKGWDGLKMASDYHQMPCQENNAVVSY